ncbi:DUF3997 domain-containing protein [Treponema denticola]|uniref:DUF3997 domain-containing protein n=1 Tax=Treponema denticola TaxID=158 RepID=UPI0020A54BE7|nr:DUF3997 domain-containing protein [Treponema denticola]UTC81978.1 hypothetical protein HGJ18_01710 [Treponema denticola]
MSDYLNLPDIPPEVLMYQYDDNFIVAKQKPRRYKEFNYTYNEGYKYSKGLDSEYYWIIKKKRKKFSAHWNIVSLLGCVMSFMYRKI